MSTKRLLVVGDDTSATGQVQKTAELLGFEVITTDSSFAFFFQMSLFKPDVIILNLNTSGQQGIELVRQLSELNPEAQLVLLSDLDKATLSSVAQAANEFGLSIFGILQTPNNSSLIRQLLILYLGSDQRRFSSTINWHAQLENANWVPTQEELVDAIENDRISLVYHPVLDCASNALTGVEALARWDVPGKASVTPDVFVPLLESNHLSSAMTYNVARHGMDSLKAIQSIYAARAGSALSTLDAPTLRLSLNISARCLEDDELPDRLESICRDSHIDPSQVVLEISESNAMNRPTKLLEVLRKLREKNFNLSIDDFGTGYSSMLHLVRMPFNEMKIDKEFVRIADTSAEARSVIKCIIDLARSLGIRSVAEGVESEDIRDFLKNCGCDSYQGYVIAKPMNLENLLGWISKHRTAL